MFGNGRLPTWSCCQSLFIGVVEAQLAVYIVNIDFDLN